VRVRPPPPAHLQTVGVDGRGRMLRWHRLFAKSKREIPEMKKTGFCVLMAACVLLLASCSSLNESAQNVQYSTKSEAPKDCKEIGEVSVDSFLPHVTMESVKNEMRNKTAAMGGNFLVIDEIKSVSSSTPLTVGSNGLMTTGGSSSSGYAGSGRAYQCPQS
jgi:hypothetical protein